MWTHAHIASWYRATLPFLLAADGLRRLSPGVSTVPGPSAVRLIGGRDPPPSWRVRGWRPPPGASLHVQSQLERFYGG
jgi:hypothetical protein